jgi:hypothetical protein
VSDGDLHFPPGQRREKPKFEPPPWERDLFDELARRKAEQEASESPDVREPTADTTAQGSDVPPAEAAGRPASEPVDQLDTERAERDQEETEKPELDMGQVEVLMMGLRAEEPRPEEAFTKATAAAGAISALIGLALTTWGLIALATPKQSGAGVLVGSLLLFGLGFMGGGVWVVFKTLRQQGVL